VAEKHGGRKEAASTPGKGTRFSIQRSCIKAVGPD